MERKRVASGMSAAPPTRRRPSVGAIAVRLGAYLVVAWGMVTILATGLFPGALAATIARAADARVLLGLLAAGQVCGHVMLSAVGHSHATTAAPPAAAMLAAHVVAVGVGALLIAACDRLCRAVSRAVRAAVRIVVAPVAVAPVVVTGGADQPLRSALLLAASVSHRGPPVSR